MAEVVEDAWDSASEFVSDAYEDTRDVVKDYVIDPTMGNFEAYGGKNYADDLKQTWDDVRGATERKEMEKAAEAAKARADEQETYARGQAAIKDSYSRGANRTGAKSGKPGAGGQRGTRLVRQPLGTYAGR
jgi:hypothetical protein